MGEFYGTGIEIWDGLATYEDGFFMFLWAKKFFLNIVDGENIFGIE